MSRDVAILSNGVVSGLFVWRDGDFTNVTEEELRDLGFVRQKVARCLRCGGPRRYARDKRCEDCFKSERRERARQRRGRSPA